jgi:HD-GYP domain-containing protein (c-di-GMP phosphodiesterase class II)
MLYDGPSGDLTITCSRGFDEQSVQCIRFNTASRTAGKVAQEGKVLLVEDIEADPRFGQKDIADQYAAKSLLSLPLKLDGRLVGVLNLSNKKDRTPFGQRDLRLASTLCERIANFMRGLNSELRSKEELSQMIGAMEHIVAAQRKYFKKKQPTTELVGRVMEILAAAEKETDLALYVSAIYDLGLVLIDHEILDKEVTLSTPETTAIHGHPYSTLDLLGDIGSSGEARKIILHHHEHYDGSGYPAGLKGDDIPLISRVLAVVDGYFAMIEARPYRGAHSREDAFRNIQAGSGTLYDPAVVTAFFQALGA